MRFLTRDLGAASQLVVKGPKSRGQDARNES